MKKSILLGICAFVMTLGALVSSTSLADGRRGGGHNDTGEILGDILAITLVAVEIDYDLTCAQKGYNYCDYYDNSGCYYQRPSEEVVTTCQTAGYYGDRTYTCVTQDNVVYLRSCGRPFDRSY